MKKERDEVFLNCPVCRFGVMELAAYVELKPGPLILNVKKRLPENIPAITLEMCSREPCNHINVGAAPESLTLTKSTLREFIRTVAKLP
jgi:hypothetical protein